MDWIKYFALIAYFTFLAINISSAQEIQKNINVGKDNEIRINSRVLQGERIFFIRKHDVAGMRIGDIYSMNSLGGDVQQLTNFSNQYFITELPEISRDGKNLTFISNFESWKSAFYLDAFIADLETGIFKRVTGDERPFPPTNFVKVRVVVRDPYSFAVSPSVIRISYKGCENFVTGDSLEIYVPADEDIWIKAEVAKGKGDIEFVRLQSGEESARIDLYLTEGTISAESCSPYLNGSKLAVSVNSENVIRPFYKIGIWESGGFPQFMQDVGNLPLGGDTYPAYSPDGSMIAFCTGEHTTNSLAILSTSNLANASTILVPGNKFGYQAFCANPSWSPDGTEIVFVYTILNGLEIQSNLYKVSVAGGTPVQLTSYSGNEVVSKPSYSPDGLKIAFTYLKSTGTSFYLTDLINGTYSSDIFVIPSNGGSVTALTNDGYSLDPSWGVLNTTVKVEQKPEEIRNEFRLSQNYPNPFNNQTTIEYWLQEPSHVSLKVFDLLGKEKATLVNERQIEGKHSVEFEAINFSSGVYIYSISANNNSISKKIILLK
jgi:Tol biopolymer transport system component